MGLIRLIPLNRSSGNPAVRIKGRDYHREGIAESIDNNSGSPIKKGLADIAGCVTIVLQSSDVGDSQSSDLREICSIMYTRKANGVV